MQPLITEIKSAQLKPAQVAKSGLSNPLLIDSSVVCSAHWLIASAVGRVASTQTGIDSLHVWWLPDAQVWLSLMCVCPRSQSVRWHLSKLRALVRIKRLSPVVIGLYVSKSPRWDGGEREVWCLTSKYCHPHNGSLCCLFVASFLLQSLLSVCCHSHSLSLPKDRLTVPVSGGGKKADSSASKPVVSCGRSSSQGSRGSDSAASAKVGGSLKRSSHSPQGSVAPQGTRQASHPGRTALRLCSSRSFSSLHTRSLTAAPFMRSSRSLSRLDQRSTRQGECTHVSFMILFFSFLCSSLAQIRIRLYFRQGSYILLNICMWWLMS